MPASNPSGLPRVALVWAQYAAYHIDRCEAVAERLKGRAEVLAVEVATTSSDYAWEPSGEIAGARKITLFPGQSYDSVSGLRRLIALYRALRHCDWVMIGLSYAEPMPAVLAWALRVSGVRLIVFSESKADDRPRRAAVECAKRLILSCYSGAIVGATRHMAYFRQLGFRKRPVLPGYDGVSLERVRRQAGGALTPDGAPFKERSFVFIGRFVDKKNLPGLLEGYALYARKAAGQARHLILAGSGVEEGELRTMVARHGLEQRVEFPGFLPAEQVSQLLAKALALVLVSREEQWGLVVNEALALGLPVLVSHQVGSRDALVRHGENGIVVSSESIEEIAAALAAIDGDEAHWRKMVAASHARAWMGDTERLADAVESVLFQPAPETRARLARFMAEIA